VSRLEVPGGPVAPDDVPLRFLPLAEQALPALLDRQAKAFGDRPLLRIGDVARSYQEVRDAAALSAGRLRAAGIRKGDRVAAMAGNRMELWDLFTGCAWLGAIAVPLNTAMRGEQLRHALTNSGARALLVEADLVRHLDVLGKLPDLEELWVLDGPAPSAPDVYAVSGPPLDGEPMETWDVHAGDPTAIMYTSGTTGPSKGVTCPSAHFYWYAVTLIEVIGIRPDDVLYNCLPLYHMNALMAPIEALVAGASCVIGERFSTSRYWENAAEAQGTITFLLGALANRLLSQPAKPSDREHGVRKLFAPGTAAPVWEPFCERFGVREIIEGYGSTETNHCIGRAPGHPESIPGKMGWVLDAYYEAKIVDEHDDEVPDGTPGELVFRNRYPFSFALGYWGMPEKTAEAFRNLWFHSGDRGVRDPDGCFRFHDRAKDSMRRLGENISSWEVEEAITSHPAVAEAAVFPVASEETDEDVMATLVLLPGATLDPVDLMRHLETRVAYFAIPRYLDTTGELPYTTNGKIQKSGLRERGVTATTWDREAAGYELRRR
jgi:crotonobetaine/carnitine-CoA ligase